MPPVVREFGDSTDRSIKFVSDLEMARLLVERSTGSCRRVSVDHLETAYEMAYLRIFIGWEDFLERSFYRYLCGYESAQGAEKLISGIAFARTIGGAKAMVLKKRKYLLWHNPSEVIDRSKRFFDRGKHEVILSSLQTRLEWMAACRHRIAHAGVKVGFDLASMKLAGKRYRGSRPGRFLRDWDVSASVPTRWIGSLAADLKGLACQIVP